ncbi:MAG: TIM barrel protein [Clostridia bacterium]
MIKISGFTDEVSSDLNCQIELLTELKQRFMCPRTIDGKNIADYTPDEFKAKILPKINAKGIKFSSIGSPIGKIKLYDDKAYDAQLQKLKNLVEIAKMVGCKYIRTFSFFVDKKGDYNVYFPKVVEKIKGFLKVVEGTNIVLLHENEKKIYGDTPERAIQLCKAVNSEQYKLCFDASNYIQCGCNPWHAYRATKPYTAYYHMKDCIDGVEVPLGLGQGRIEKIVLDLVASGYDGFLTIEPHTFRYAVMKLPFYLCPPLAMSVKNSLKVFRQIDQKMKIKMFEKVNRKQVYVWQYENMKKLLDKAGVVNE